MTRKLQEIGYCQNVLNPLFETMLPYIENLRYRHGNMEFGKDFTFSYVNPLNQRVNVGIQAKWGDIAGSSTSLVDEIVSQIKVAFSVPYKNKPDGQELHLNELYIVCSGKFTDNAITIIENTLERDFNVSFLDGSDMELLRRKFAQRIEAEKSETRRALNALLIELDQNIGMAKAIDSQMEEYIQKNMHFLTSFRLNCLQRVLELDIDDKWILDEAVIQWTNLTIDNNRLEQIRLSLTGKERLKMRKKTLWDDIKRDITNLEDLRKYVASYLERLQ
ncbi:hypothetical protein MUO83_02435 [Candidatus Bathyarchaeota archaeon]|nr:hypothetical protein [Candidatus Bathyarchaeota archaeon]